MIKKLLLGAVLLPTLAVDTPTTDAYKPSAIIRQQIQSGEPGAHYRAAWDFSYIGEYQAALASYDEPQRGRPARRISAADSAACVKLKPVDARTYLLQRAKAEQILIINEAHHVPLHRTFTASLLPELAKLGFRYFAAEGLSEMDTLLQQRGYPVLTTGFYTKEPQFGHLLRTAHQTGFQLVAYDYGFSHTGEMEAQVRARETAQARNLQRILQADPKAKIVVHCGFSHNNEGPNGMGSLPAMAGHLKALTGIDPFTIDQVSLTEAGYPGAEARRYRLVEAAGSSVLLDAQGKAFNRADENRSVDVNVYHPRTTYQAGRPSWVFAAGRKATHFPADVTGPVGYPCLVLAYSAAEDLAQAVPVDVVELQSPQDRKALALPDGTHTLVIKGPAGKVRTWTLK